MEILMSFCVSFKAIIKSLTFSLKGEDNVSIESDPGNLWHQPIPLFSAQIELEDEATTITAIVKIFIGTSMVLASIFG